MWQKDKAFLKQISRAHFCHVARLSDSWFEKNANDNFNLEKENNIKEKENGRYYSFSFNNFIAYYTYLFVEILHKSFKNFNKIIKIEDWDSV